jgi:hypothetical protein
MDAGLKAGGFSSPDQSKFKTEKECNIITLLEVLMVLMTCAKESRVRSRKFGGIAPCFWKYIA